ncbi:hypothetical protein ABTX84_33495, partial [Streptomyces sp. NPDC095614]
PHYVRLKKTEFERIENKEITRKELDNLRATMKVYTPEELFELRNKSARVNQGIKDFSGIYIICNTVTNDYYVGQAENVFDRAYKHFVADNGSRELYLDYYRLGHEFSISLVPLEKTSFSDLNELEGNGIAAYDSYTNGYNKVQGNYMDKPSFKNEDYQSVAELLLDRIKETEEFSALKNDSNRRNYIQRFFQEQLNLPFDVNLHWGFMQNLTKMIRQYQKANKYKKN